MLSCSEIVRVLDEVLRDLNGSRDIELYRELKAFFERKYGYKIEQHYGEHYIK